MSNSDTEIGGLAVDRLRSLIERIERLEEEQKALSSDIRDIFAEAKSAGFDVKIMRTIIKLRKMNAADRDEQEPCSKPIAVLWIYRRNIMEKQIEEQLKKLENELFSSFLGSSIASIVAGKSTKEEEIQLLEQAKKGFQRNIEMVTKGIETIKNLNIKEGSKDE